MSLRRFSILVPHWHQDGAFNAVQQDGTIAKVNFYTPRFREVSLISAQTAEEAVTLAKRRGYAAPIVAPLQEFRHAQPTF